MIFFFENGRLGNQVLQYCGLRTQFRRQKLVLVGCQDLFDCFAKLEGTQLRIVRPVRRLLYCIFRFLVWLRFFGLIEEGDRGSGSIVFNKGLININLVGLNFFYQHEKFEIDTSLRLKFKQGVIDQARSFLVDNGFDTSNRLVFVHVRRGDYAYWPSEDFPAILPVDWYKEQMCEYMQRFPNVNFFFVSDDPEFVKCAFGNTVVVSRLPVGADLCLMSLCAGGILSASSLSWVGSHLSRTRRSSSSCGSLACDYVGPKFWAGHSSGQWFPVGFKSPWILYAPVDKKYRIEKSLDGL